ncbi:MAG: hypothetical protein PHR77_01660 [Kiritimatiellae bacterium]|nr:hypothetical protein [Kiritimatiellia bacterium]MDD5521913.1 hypothetical protein [Kiritimatiellia bacterium]
MVTDKPAPMLTQVDHSSSVAEQRPLLSGGPVVPPLSEVLESIINPGSKPVVTAHVPVSSVSSVPAPTVPKPAAKVPVETSVIPVSVQAQSKPVAVAPSPATSIPKPVVPPPKSAEPAPKPVTPPAKVAEIPKPQPAMPASKPAVLVASPPKADTKPAPKDSPVPAKTPVASATPVPVVPSKTQSVPKSSSTVPVQTAPKPAAKVPVTPVPVQAPPKPVAVTPSPATSIPEPVVPFSHLAVPNPVWRPPPTASMPKPVVPPPKSVGPASKPVMPPAKVAEAPKPQPAMPVSKPAVPAAVPPKTEVKPAPKVAPETSPGEKLKLKVAKAEAPTGQTTKAELPSFVKNPADKKIASDKMKKETILAEDSDDIGHQPLVLIAKKTVEKQKFGIRNVNFGLAAAVLILLAFSAREIFAKIRTDDLLRQPFNGMRQSTTGQGVQGAGVGFQLPPLEMIIQELSGRPILSMPGQRVKENSPGGNEQTPQAVDWMKYVQDNIKLMGFSGSSVEAWQEAILQEGKDKDSKLHFVKAGQKLPIRGQEILVENIKNDQVYLTDGKQKMMIK